MNNSIAAQRYRERHVEPGLPAYRGPPGRWQYALVIPAYREAADLLDTLAAVPASGGPTLVILVLNRPDSDADKGANTELRTALHSRAGQKSGAAANATVALNAHTDLLLHDLESLRGPSPTAQGVGLARKSGCDLALQWMHTGAITGEWICSSDADATLPPGYFSQLDAAPGDAVAAVFPFRHDDGPEAAYNAATALYELRLHQYVLGLDHAGSPYAYHTLGSSLAVRALPYMQVRGFPKRSGGEDFYLLNKLAKLGPVARIQGSCIRLQSRPSDRVPFGTGPAVARIVEAADPMATPLFYHPACFAALREILATLPGAEATDAAQVPELLRARGLGTALCQASHEALLAAGLERALEHCRRQGKTPAQYRRQFHQWFDGFRTLKFIHALRSADWPQQSLNELGALQPWLWPTAPESSIPIPTLRTAVRAQWGWD